MTRDKVEGNANADVNHDRRPRKYPKELAGLSTRYWLGLVALSCVALGTLMALLESDSRRLDGLHADATHELIIKERRQQASLMVEQTLGVISSRHRDYEHRLQRLMITAMRNGTLGAGHLSGLDRSHISTELMRQFPDLRINPDWISVEQLPTVLMPAWWSEELNLRLQSDEPKSQFIRGTDAGLVFAVPLDVEGTGQGEVRGQRSYAGAEWTLIHIDPDMVAFLVASELRQSLHASLDKQQSRYVWINEILNPKGGDDYARRLIHPLLPKTEGMSLSTDYQDSSGGYPYRVELEGVLRGRGIFFDYQFPKTPGAPAEDKTAYAALYPPFQWIVASGVYLDDIKDAAVLAHADTMESKHELERWHFLIILGVTLLLCLAIGHAIFRQNTVRERFMRRRMLQLESKLEQRGEDRLITTLHMLRDERCPERAGDGYLFAEYVTAIANELGLHPEEVNALERTALLYDIGRLALPDTLLNPGSQLHFDQQQLMRQHVDIGSRLVKDALKSPFEASLLEASQDYMLGGHSEQDNGKPPRTLGPGILALVVQVLELVRHGHLSETEAVSEVEHRSPHPFSPEVLQASRRIFAENPVAPAVWPMQSKLTPRQIERFAVDWRDHATGCFTRRLLETSLIAIRANDQAALPGCITLSHLKLRTSGDAQCLDHRFGPNLLAACYPRQVFHLAIGHFVILGELKGDEGGSRIATLKQAQAARQPLFSRPPQASSRGSSDLAIFPLASPPTPQALEKLLQALDGDARLDAETLRLSCAESLKDWWSRIDALTS